MSDWLDQWIDSVEEAAEVEEQDDPAIFGEPGTEAQAVFELIDRRAAEDAGLTYEEVKRRLAAVHEERRRGRGV